MVRVEVSVVNVLDDLRWRGLVHQVTDDALGEALAAPPVVVYHGIDATADSLHVGNLLGILVLQRLQRAGHRPIVLLGGGTTLIGDPSGKQSERPMREAGEVRSNIAGLRAQLAQLIDFEPSAGPAQALLVDNADWLSPLPLTDFLRDIGKHFTVNAMMAKDSVRARLEEREQGISFTEFTYMLLQAYDFLHLFDAHGCRLEVGGSDQWGNITAGVDLVRRVRGEAVAGLTWPLLTKADGAKFGKSEEGNVWLDPARTSPYEFFQFWLNSDDAEVGPLLRKFTDLDRAEIERLEGTVATAPAAREAHRVLARSVTSAVHGAEATEAAEAAAAALFGGALGGLDAATLGQVFADAPSVSLPAARIDGGGVPLLALLVEAGVSPSRSAARREVGQGGIYLNNTKASDAEARVTRADLLAGSILVLRRGKRTYHLVRFGE